MAQIRLWCVASGECLHVLQYHYHDVTCMAFSRDDRLLVSAGNFLDNTVASRRCESVRCVTASQVVWDTYTGLVLGAAQVEEPVWLALVRCSLVKYSLLDPWYPVGPVLRE